MPRVKDIMDPHVRTVTGEASLREVARLMRDTNTGAIPVVDANGSPRGIITDRDLGTDPGGTARRPQRRMDFATAEKLLEANGGRLIRPPRDAAGGPVAPILDAAELAVTLRRTRSVHLDRLREGLRGVPMLYAPELFTRSHGIRATSQLAEALAAELGY